MKHPCRLQNVAGEDGLQGVVPRRGALGAGSNGLLCVPPGAIWYCGIVGEGIRDRLDAIYALSGTHYMPGSAYRSAGKLSAMAPLTCMLEAVVS